MQHVYSPTGGVNGGFMTGDSPALAQLPPSMPIYTRGAPEALNGLRAQEQALRKQLKGLKRTTLTGTVNDILAQLDMTRGQLERAITSSMTAFPVRENLEAEAKILIPLETPLRNRLARVPGSGLASKWKVVTSLGGGYGGATTSTASGNTAGQATVTVVNSGGIVAGDTLIIGTGGTQETKIVASVDYSTHVITLSTNLANAQNSVPVVKASWQPGGNEAIRAFFAESGSPSSYSTVYADKTASYKLLGTKGSVTGFAMAAGANFQNQLATEKNNSVMNLMLNEEWALINGNSTIVAPPHGDGTNALAFDGLLKSISTANGTPADQIQTAVGALTVAHIDNQLRRLWTQGARGYYMLVNSQESLSMVHLAEASGSIIRVQATSDGKTVLGVTVTGYVHPITGEVIPVDSDRFLAPGTMIFGCTQLPDGSPAADVEVLPQVQLPELAPNTPIQGYTAQEIAPASASPQVYEFITTVFEVLRVKSAVHFAKSTGLTAV